MKTDAILVVEDGDDQRDLLASLLEDAGFEVRACSNAVEALSLMERWQPSAILLDWYLPFLGGEAFVRRLRASPTFAEVPVVVLTGALRLNTEGVEAVLLKPIDFTELLVVLRRVLARAHAVGRSVPQEMEAHG